MIGANLPTQIFVLSHLVPLVSEAIVKPRHSLDASRVGDLYLVTYHQDTIFDRWLLQSRRPGCWLLLMLHRPWWPVRAFPGVGC